MSLRAAALVLDLLKQIAAWQSPLLVAQIATGGKAPPSHIVRMPYWNNIFDIFNSLQKTTLHKPVLLVFNQLSLLQFCPGYQKSPLRKAGDFWYFIRLLST